VPRFVAEELYSGSFGFQWNRFSRTQLDSANGTTRSRDTFLEKTQWRLEELSGKQVLDAGCGMGRFAEVAAAAGAELHGVDLSTAVEAARRNLDGRAAIHLYQADIMNLPFPDGSFDLIYSIGVLHHTPDTKAAFLKLVPLLKPGGGIAIWIYSRELRAFFGSELLRRITPRLPKSWLLGACRIAIPLYYIHRIPRVGTLTCRCLPTSMNPDPEWRWLDTFDWYSPPYQWKHTCEEVEAWCAEAGLTSISRGPIPVSVRAIRPLS
jgi:SAM-dependent methyltransferase